MAALERPNRECLSQTPKGPCVCSVIFPRRPVSSTPVSHLRKSEGHSAEYIQRNHSAEHPSLMQLCESTTLIHKTRNKKGGGGGIRQKGEILKGKTMKEEKKRSPVYSKLHAELDGSLPLLFHSFFPAHESLGLILKVSLENELLLFVNEGFEKWEGSLSSIRLSRLGCKHGEIHLTTVVV